MKHQNLIQLFRLASVCAMLSLSAFANATVLSTYNIQSIYTYDLNHDFTFSFDVTTKNSCTSCTLTDLTSTSPANIIFTTSVPGDTNWTPDSNSFLTYLSFSTSTNTLSSFDYAGNFQNTDTNSPLFDAGAFSITSLLLYYQLPGPNDPAFTFSNSSSVNYLGSKTISSTVPEPASLALLGIGLLGLSVNRKRIVRKRSSHHSA